MSVPRVRILAEQAWWDDYADLPREDEFGSQIEALRRIRDHVAYVFGGPGDHVSVEAFVPRIGNPALSGTLGQRLEQFDSWLSGPYSEYVESEDDYCCLPSWKDIPLFPLPLVLGASSGYENANSCVALASAASRRLPDAATYDGTDWLNENSTTEAVKTVIHELGHLFGARHDHGASQVRDVVWEHNTPMKGNYSKYRHDISAACGQSFGEIEGSIFRTFGLGYSGCAVNCQELFRLDGSREPVVRTIWPDDYDEGVC